ncbi:porin family protein [uncultured Pontibacter sp.]|uniref:porin family protein n=1 Tax=uncultured Pontibacter sp. TaxID=453356 RepID=UPI002634F529|nr:porin family protein [uncultured Pontibacter sp.]
MKIKRPLIIFLFALIGHSGYSQVSIGARAGLNFARIVSALEEAETRGFKRGYYAGATAQVELSERRFVRAELLYTQKGNRYGASFLSPDGGESTFHYAAVAWHHGYRPTEKLSLLLGPQVGKLMSANTRFADKSFDITDSYSKWDLGLDLGLEYRITAKLGIETRYTYGFRLMSETQDRRFGGTSSSSGRRYDGANRVLQIGLIYFLKEGEDRAK